MLRLSESQNDRVVRRAPIPLMTTSLYDLVKTRSLDLQAERKHLEGVRTGIVIGLFFHFCLQLRKWSKKRNWKKMETFRLRFCELMTPLTTLMFYFYMAMSTLMIPGSGSSFFFDP